MQTKTSYALTLVVLKMSRVINPPTSVHKMFSLGQRENFTPSPSNKVYFF